ncbi:MAG: HD domain-containing protein [Candidatus Micrarchaeota archaeon]
MDEIIRQIEADVKPYYSELDIVHDWNHIQRVRKYALKIGKIENADLRVLEIAALMHDIGRKEADENNHSEKSWEIAKKMLEKCKLNDDEKYKILDAVKGHSFHTKYEPQTKEGVILRDADKLDLSGAMGIARILIAYGSENKPFEKIMEMYKKKLIENLKIPVKTEEARKIVDSEYPLILDFYENFMKKIK